MLALLAVPLLAVFATAAPHQNINRYQGPTGRPIVFAKKSFFEDLAVQPSVPYRLVAIPAFDTRPVFSLDENTIETAPPLYFKGDSRLYGKNSFGDFSRSSGPKVYHQEALRTIRGGYFRPHWEVPQTAFYEPFVFGKRH